MRSREKAARWRWARLPAVLGVLMLACACDDGGTDPLTVSVEDGTPGHYGGPCNPDGSCGEGLVCQHHVCVQAGE